MDFHYGFSRVWIFTMGVSGIFSIVSNIWENVNLDGIMESSGPIYLPSLKLTANAPENKPSRKETIGFQPSMFRGYVIVSGRVIRCFGKRQQIPMELTPARVERGFWGVKPDFFGDLFVRDAGTATVFWVASIKYLRKKTTVWEDPWVGICRTKSNKTRDTWHITRFQHFESKDETLGLSTCMVILCDFCGGAVSLLQRCFLGTLARDEFVFGCCSIGKTSRS